MYMFELVSCSLRYLLTKGRPQKKNGKISDIVQNSNYPLPPWPNNDK